MECVILYRINGGKIEFVRDAPISISPEVFPDRDAAVDFAENHQPFRNVQVDYQIVELDEL
jgi:hypothetical protein